MKITFLGHVSIDKDIVRGQEHVHFGGGVLHGSITGRRLGAQVELVTKCAEADRAHFTAPGEAGVHTTFLPSETSTSIQNLYPSENPDDRVSTLIARAEPFAASDLEGITADALLVNPLWFGELPPELLPLAKKQCRTLGIDAQGFLRRAQPDGTMALEDWPEKAELLRHVDLLKVDAREAEVLTGSREPRVAARRLGALGAGTVLLTHRDGVCVWHADTLHEAAFGEWTLEGRTGRGDTCTASFLFAHETMDIDEATRFAARITTRKMQYPGPYRGE